MVYDSAGTPKATNVYLCAAWHKSVLVTCHCGHTALFNGDGLWWLCERKGWSVRFADLRRRFYCKRCWHGDCRKVRPRWVEASNDRPDTILPHPPESEARREARRFR